MKTPVAYIILSKCGQVYIEETGRSINTRVKHISVDRLDGSPVAGHISMKHQMQLQNSCIPLHPIIREVNVTELHHN